MATTTHEQVDASPHQPQPAPFWTGTPALLGYPAFVLGSIALGLALVGFVPASAQSSVLPIAMAAAGVGVFLSALWSMALGQALSAGIFGVFAGFWWSYGLLVLGLTHHWYGIPPSGIAKSQELFLLSWTIIMLALTVATLRLPAAFPALLALVTAALALATVSAANGSVSLSKAAGAVALGFAALGLYMFLGEASSATGGKPYPLGAPVLG